MNFYVNSYSLENINNYVFLKCVKKFWIIIEGFPISILCSNRKRMIGFEASGKFKLKQYFVLAKIADTRFTSKI